MSDLRDLYQEVILDHSKKPRNYGRLAASTHRADGQNPLCGDEIHLQVRLEGDTIRDLAFEGSGCAISKASASIMTQSIKGKTKEQAEALFQRFHQMVTGKGSSEAPNAAFAAESAKLAVFAGVAEFPARVKCASLAWHTLRAALEGQAQPVSTEGT